MSVIRIAIVGMGNVGAQVARIARADAGFEVAGKFDRENFDEIWGLQGRVDVVLVCVGSAKDAPEVTPRLAEKFCTVDSYDVHNEIGTYTAAVSAQRGSKSVNIVGAGWDPGLLSVARVLFAAVLPGSRPLTLYGPGVSLGHTNALKSVRGVRDAQQETVPVVKKTYSYHRRVCHVVADEADRERIVREVISMPHYFAPYQTEVHFVPKIRASKRHAGRVVCEGDGTRLEVKVRMRSNPAFTAGVMLAYARANYHLQKEGRAGVFTAADIAPKYLLPQGVAEFI